MLGKNGELGNQMFQYAALYALGKRTGVECVIPSDILTGKSSLRPANRPAQTQIELYQAFDNLSLRKLDTKEILKKITTFVEPNESSNFVYNEGIFSTPSPNIINGYFQSPMYFDDISHEIRAEYSFSDNLVSSMLRKIEGYKNTSGSKKICAVHFRKSDYSEKSNYHTNLKWENYYLPAIRAISNRFDDISFLAFSDDIEWCKKNLPDIFMFSDAKNQYEDLCLMSLCDAHIIANSSFSWWGSYLANKEHVVAPYKWFEKEGPSRWETIYCPHWVVI